jgi:hypothetical protein
MFLTRPHRFSLPVPARSKFFCKEPHAFSKADLHPALAQDAKHALTSSVLLKTLSDCEVIYSKYCKAVGPEKALNQSSQPQQIRHVKW